MLYNIILYHAYFLLTYGAPKGTHVEENIKLKRAHGL